MYACTTEIRACIDVENDYGMCTASYIHVKHCILHDCTVEVFIIIIDCTAILYTDAVSILVHAWCA